MSGFDEADCTCKTASAFHRIHCDKARALLATHGVRVGAPGATRCVRHDLRFPAFKDCPVCEAEKQRDEARIEEAKRRMYEAQARLTDAPHASSPMVGLDALLPPLSPAAMLGDALTLLGRVRGLLEDAGLEPMGGLMYDFNEVVQRVKSRRDVYTKREADVLESKHAASARVVFRDLFRGPESDRQLADVATPFLESWLARSERMLMTPETPLLQEAVRAELRRRAQGTAKEESRA